MGEFIGPGDIVVIKSDPPADTYYYHVITISGNGKNAFLRRGLPEAPANYYVAVETKHLAKQTTLTENV